MRNNIENHGRKDERSVEIYKKKSKEKRKAETKSERCVRNYVKRLGEIKKRNSKSLVGLYKQT